MVLNSIKQLQWKSSWGGEHHVLFPKKPFSAESNIRFGNSKSVSILKRHGLFEGYYYNYKSTYSNNLIDHNNLIDNSIDLILKHYPKHFRHEFIIYISSKYFVKLKASLPLLIMALIISPRLRGQATSKNPPFAEPWTGIKLVLLNI